MGARAGGAGGGAAGHAPTGGAHRGGHRQPGGVPPSRPSPAGRRCARACPGAARGAPGGHHAPGEPGAQVRAVSAGSTHQHPPVPGRQGAFPPVMRPYQACAGPAKLFHHTGMQRRHCPWFCARHTNYTHTRLSLCCTRMGSAGCTGLPCKGVVLGSQQGCSPVDFTQ